ncbi:MAG: hypothetical protein RIQ60_1251 [Pseudomonadota bacterium]
MTQLRRYCGVADQQGPALLIERAGAYASTQAGGQQRTHGIHAGLGFGQPLLQPLQGLALREH